jgi:dTDP-4-amino-4,6-dideoxygalactose transaminase
LTELWEYNWVIDGKYSTIKDNLINLQIRIGLISSENDTWAAGYFWNKTRSALWIYYENATSSVASSNNILSDSEKNRMKTAYNIVVIKLQNEEKRWAKSAKTRLDNLDKQIEIILPSISDTQLKLKLIFLQELI